MNKTLIPSQAVILAAGINSRFIPFNSRGYHKSNFLLMGESIIQSAVKALIKTGIKEIVIVTSPDDKVIQKSLINAGGEKNKIKFIVQKNPLGMASALLEARPILKESFIVLNPQQINIDTHLSQLNRTGNPSENAIYLFSHQTDQPQKYGVLGLKGNKVTRVVEKPTDLSGLSNQRVLGIYILNSKFMDFIGKFKVTEYLLEEALNKYASECEIIAIESNYPTLSLKYVWDLFPIVSHKFSQFPKKPQIHKKAWIHPSAIVSGAVVIEEGAKVYEYALIQGPCYIGKNAVVGSFCKVRNETVIEEGVELQNAVEAKHSIIENGTHIHSGFVGDSIVGENCRIGAGFITANRKLNRSNIQVLVKEKLIDVGTSFGCIIGDNVRIGIHCGTNPGTVISSNSLVLPMTIVSHQK